MQIGSKTMRQGFIRSMILIGLGACLVLIPIGLAWWLLPQYAPKHRGLDRPDYAAQIHPPDSLGDPLPQRLSTLMGDALDLNAPIPRVFMTRLPESLSDMTDSNKRKRVFILTLLPLILHANELIKSDRAHTLELVTHFELHGSFSEWDQAWLEGQMRRYRVKADTVDRATLHSLLERQDTIPPSLALAQAAIETGWGTSFFSQEGNALYGEWVFDQESEGMVPRGREEGKTHRVKKFDYLIDSVVSYMTNLNRHRSYAGLRDRRTELRQLGLPVTGAALAPALIHYSERGGDYVSDLLSIMSYNGFAAFDDASLANG